jgi:hypothetical protein
MKFSVTGCEERTPEPKPRWNPKPEQIRILEAIFNSGMVNPPRDEIRKIRAQLQEYGQVGDANVFYWFQNRKSRSKHKLRHLQLSLPRLHRRHPLPRNHLPKHTTRTPPRWAFQMFRILKMCRPTMPISSPTVRFFPILSSSRCNRPEGFPFLSCQMWFKYPRTRLDLAPVSCSVR